MTRIRNDSSGTCGQQGDGRDHRSRSPAKPFKYYSPCNRQPGKNAVYVHYVYKLQPASIMNSVTMPVHAI